jgi:hypothetical protein
MGPLALALPPTLLLLTEADQVALAEFGSRIGLPAERKPDTQAPFTR